MPRSPQSPLHPAAGESSDRVLAKSRVVFRLGLSLALAAAAGAVLPGATACSPCDLYYHPIEWSTEESPVGVDLFAVAAAKDVALAVGDGGTIVRQAAGQAWTPVASGTEVALRGVDFAGAEVAVAVGDGGIALRSTDGGVSWAAVDVGVTVDLAGVRCSDEGACAAVGDDTLLVSADGGATWAPPTAAPAELGALRAVEVDPRAYVQFVAVGLAGAVVVSDDGQTWTAVPGVSADLRAVALDGSDWALGGAGGALFILINGEFVDESQFESPAITGIARDGRWLVREDGLLIGGRPAWWEEESVRTDEALRPLHAVVSVGEEALVVGDGGLVGRARISEERECDRR